MDMLADEAVLLQAGEHVHLGLEPLLVDLRMRLAEAARRWAGAVDHRAKQPDLALRLGRALH